MDNVIGTEEEIPLEDFFLAYYECRRNKRNKASQLTFEWNYEDGLVRLWREVNTMTYEIGRSVCFLVTRPKLREVFAADFRDRIVHHVIMQRLEPIIEAQFIADTYNCRKNKGVFYGVNRLHEMIREASNGYKTECWIAKCDITGFFMSIDKRLLLEKLMRLIETSYNGNDKRLLSYLVKKVVMHCPQYNCTMRGDQSRRCELAKDKSLFTCGDDKGMPIGNLTSQIFANFYMSEFDHIMKERYGYYGRYVDDYFVVTRTKEEAKMAVRFSTELLWHGLLLRVNPKKTYIQPYYNGVKFTGSVIKRSRIYGGSRTIGNALAAIRRMKDDSFPDYMKCGMTINSYLGFLVHSRSYRKRMDIIEAIPDNVKAGMAEMYHNKVVPIEVAENRKRKSEITQYKSKRKRYYNKRASCRKKTTTSMPQRLA